MSFGVVQVIQIAMGQGVFRNTVITESVISEFRYDGITIKSRNFAE